MKVTIFGVVLALLTIHRSEAQQVARPLFKVAQQSEVTLHGGYSPSTISLAYDVGAQGDGTGQTIAVIEAYGSPTIQNDYKFFNQTYFPHQRNLPLQILNLGTDQQTDEDWAFETSIDAEWAHAIAPGAQILIVEAKSDSPTDLLSAVDAAVEAGATVVSMSWGLKEWSEELSSDIHFSQGKAVNVNFFAAAGDWGTGTTVFYPATSPFVTSVGGTTLTMFEGTRVQSEVAWDETSSGISAYEPAPEFQKSVQDFSNRSVPDVAYDANPETGIAVYDTTGYAGLEGWIQAGGTSIGAPQWAGIAALRNSSSTQPVISFNETLYKLATSTDYKSTFRDIVKGCDFTNDRCATKGFDILTGFGTPKVGSLVKNLLN